MVALVAIRDGFYGGARIRRGVSFDFDEKASALPKWAKPAAEAAKFIAEEQAKEIGVDIKPAAATKAAIRRSGAVTAD